MLAAFISGLAIGALYAAVALSYNVMFLASKVLSVSTGHNAMLGGIAGAYLIGTLGWPAPLGLLGVAVAGAALGLLTEFIAIRRVLARSDQHLWLLSTLALATILQQGAALGWGTEPRPFPRLLAQDFSAGLADQKYWLPIATLALLALALEVLTRRTMFGKIFRAISEDAFAARARGIAVGRMRAFSYAIAGMIGAIAGFAAGQLTFAYFALGLTLTLYGFIALAAGGLGSNFGAIIGGLGLGVLDALASYEFGGEYRQTIAVGLLLVVLILRPNGLFGHPQSRPV